MNGLVVWHDPPPERIGSSAVELLRNLGGPGAIFVRGEDSTRMRAVATLLHGNEPSGVRAMHAWLRRGRAPRVDCVWVVGAVEAALAPPGFAYRHLQGRSDLNRCFRPPYEGVDGEIARAILDLLDRARPEALLDLHNNTGHNPPYGIATRVDATTRGLCAWFAERLVKSDLDLGALVEVNVRGAPSVTIECGLAGDFEADRVALRGVEAFLGSDALLPPVPRDVAVYEQPIRVSIRSGTTLAIAAARRSGVGLTLAWNVDRHNWTEVGPGTTIGWVADDAEWPVEAFSPDGVDVSRELFEIEAGVLRTRRSLIPIMITTDAVIAASDCLFYVVRRAQ